MAVPEVTVIVPTLNTSKSIDSALQSVINAAGAVFKRVEILVIDGGSGDGTLERVALYPQVEILHQNSKGLAAARNEAVAKTSSLLVAFCDADDVWVEGSLAKKLEVLHASAKTWAVSGRVRFENIESDSIGLAVKRRSGEEHKGYTPGAMLVRRPVLEAIAFDERLSIAADTDWFIRAVTTFGDMTHLDETVLIKGLRPGSLSTDVSTYRKELLMSVRKNLSMRGKQSEGK
jgi:glycosyltransferase involved in cell wall biosynthesis